MTSCVFSRIWLNGVVLILAKDDQNTFNVFVLFFFLFLFSIFISDASVEFHLVISKFQD